jgi:hypothetical protein
MAAQEARQFAALKREATMIRAVDVLMRWLAKNPSTLAVVLSLATGATAVAQAGEAAKWKPFELSASAGSPQVRTLFFGAKGSYRIVRRDGKFISIEARIDRGAVDLDVAQNQKLSEPLLPWKVQLVAGYRQPDNKLWMIPYHTAYAAPMSAPTRVRLEKKTAAHYEVTSPVLTFSVANEDQDLSKYVLFAMVYITKAGAYAPAQSAKLQP